MQHIYFDNSATTALCPEAKQKMMEMTEVFGNPSSLHTAGRLAAAEIKAAREAVARSLGLRSVGAGELVFTSCGTEADTLAVLGTAHAKTRRAGAKIVTTDAEHSAIENVMRQLESEGFEVVRIRTKGGVLDEQQLDAALDERTVLVSMMMVNNETGAMYDLKSAFAKAKARNPMVVTHTDAVQGYLKCPFTPASIKADLVSVSAHKVHGPKGVGALYIHPALLKAKQITPVLLGGGQEFGLRSGTENTIGIAAFGAAVSAISARMTEDRAHMETLRLFLGDELLKMGVGVKQPMGASAPHILNVTLPDIKSETMLHFLDARGICVSSGSACASHGRSVSRALLAFGCSEREADCSLRISLCPSNTKDEAQALLDAVRAGLDSLIRMKK